MASGGKTGPPRCLRRCWDSKMQTPLLRLPIDYEAARRGAYDLAVVPRAETSLQTSPTPARIMHQGRWSRRIDDEIPSRAPPLLPRAPSYGVPSRLWATRIRFGSEAPSKRAHRPDGLRNVSRSFSRRAKPAQMNVTFFGAFPCLVRSRRDTISQHPKAG
jgi:hypothetical protein